MNDIALIPIDLIDPHPHNPRRHLGDLEEITNSIKTQGIRQNLLLVPNGGRFTTVIGHRRCAAAKLAGLTEVPAAVDADLDEAGQLELMLLENVQRQDLSPVEEADCYQELLDLGVTKAEIARKTGRAGSTIASRLKLAKLPEPAREKVHTGQATLLDASELDEFAKHPKQLKRLSEAIGTNNFGWELADARREVKIEAAKKVIIARLKALGIPHKPGGDAYAYNDWRQIQPIPSVAALQKVDIAGLPEGAVWVESGRIDLIRPVTDEERAAEDGRDANWEADRAERGRKRVELRQAWETRDEFVRGVLNRAVSAAEANIIIGAVPLILHHPPNLDVKVRTWLGIGWNDLNIREAFAEQVPNASPAALLLLCLHFCAGEGGEVWWEDEAMTGYYEVLEQLGYSISDVERARLTPPSE